MRLTRRLPSRPRINIPKVSVLVRFKHLSPYQLIGYSILAFSMIGFGLFQLSTAFDITHIECRLDYEPCPIVIQAEFNHLIHTKLYYLPLSSLSKKISALPTITQVTFTPRYPHTLSVELTSNQPVAYIQGADGSYVVSVDATGRVIDQLDTSPTNKYRVNHSLSLNLRPGDHLAATPLLETISLINVLRSMGFPPLTLTLITSTTIIADLPQGQKALFTATKSYLTQVTALQQILSVATIDSSTPVIDVRFDQPVLKQTAK